MLPSRLFDRRTAGLGNAVRFASRAAALAVLLAVPAAPARAQTIDDGIMMPKNALCTGFVYMHDSWDQYWEGTTEGSRASAHASAPRSVR